jgi:hypothetical protein
MSWLKMSFLVLKASVYVIDAPVETLCQGSVSLELGVMDNPQQLWHSIVHFDRSYQRPWRSLQVKYEFLGYTQDIFHYFNKQVYVRGLFNTDLF